MTLEYTDSRIPAPLQILERLEKSLPFSFRHALKLGESELRPLLQK